MTSGAGSAGRAGSAGTAPGAAPGVFEMLKVGIGPSSSHTLGPWRAAQQFVTRITAADLLPRVTGVRVLLYGSLALTGTGHGTDIAVMMGLSGTDPVTVPLPQVNDVPRHIRETGTLRLAGDHAISFDPDIHIEYRRQERLPDHANGMRFQAWDDGGATPLLERTAYSIGGGFVMWDESPDDGQRSQHNLPASARPHDLSTGDHLLAACRSESCSIAEIARANERATRSDAEIDDALGEIWRVMRDAVHRGCRTSGILPGELKVTRRAPSMAARLTERAVPDDPEEWLAALADSPDDFSRVLKLVGCFSMAVNEENASFGRIVTAPTNGSAGVIPAVLLYYRYFSGRTEGSGTLRSPNRSAARRPPGAPREVIDFLLVAGIMGGIFKTGATISAAMGGCQAEIGVSSAMAAAALAEGLGGTPQQAVMAAEIAMEHHLGLTCDPVGGLVQIPCIERNSMGAIKAITAAHIALESDSSLAKVSLDEVVRTMWSTAQDMNDRYKETSLGGLAVNVSVRIPEC
ncbi:MAG: L-serine ammonia-lyase [Alkalispirochaeta sp.]